MYAHTFTHTHTHTNKHTHNIHMCTCTHSQAWRVSWWSHTPHNYASEPERSLPESPLPANGPRQRQNNPNTTDRNGEFVCTCTRMQQRPPIWWRKTFANSSKTSKFVKVFSLESFPLYGTSHGINPNTNPMWDKLGYPQAVNYFFLGTVLTDFS